MTGVEAGELARPTPLLPELPRSLQVEVTGACNLSCPMCLVSHRPRLGRSEGAISIGAFRALVDSLPELEEVTLQGLGEPLLSPHLLEMVETLKSRGIRCGFNTNATLLGDRLARRLVELRLDWLHVSLDGASAGAYERIRRGATFERVERNVVGLLTARRGARAVLPEVRLVFVAMKSNLEELPRLVRLAAAWGVDGVWVQNLSHSFADADPAAGYRGIRDFTLAEALWAEDGSRAEDVFAEAQRLAGRLGVRLRLPRLSARPRWRRKGEPGCDWPWRSAYVEHTGRVQPCCMLMGADRAALGSVGEGGLPPVWSGPAYRAFRAQLLTDRPPSVCAGCSLYRGVF